MSKEWGVWVEGIDTWLIEGYDNLFEDGWVPIVCKYNSKAEAEAECKWLNSGRKDKPYVPKEYTDDDA